MSDHLPECPSFGASFRCDGPKGPRPCICPALEACQTRTLDAARDAVNGIEHWASYSPDGDVWTCFASDPVHVIDALRENR